MDLIIVRHGRPERDEREEGQAADPSLSIMGRRQAELTADFLQCESITRIASSTMNRARQTAEPLADMLGIEIELHDALCEVDRESNRYVPMEEMTNEDPIVAEFLNDPWSLFNGDFEGFKTRVLDGFDAIVQANRGGTVAVFCHGMVMGVYLMTQLGVDDPFRFNIDYCGIMRVQASSNGVRSIRSVNETGHVRHTLE
ncbi:MAG: histidine phosphatase family protein [Acidobacteria bacterium]|nr:histidine phosphatase family protein [Acidobacteriota bacterium]